MSNETPRPRDRSIEDRKFERVQIKVPVYIAIDGGTFRKTIHLESRDVSGGGLAFETSRKIPLNAKSKVVVSKIGEVAEPAMIHGRVAHRSKDPVTGRYTIGLEFIEFVNVTREQLLAHIDTWSRELSEQVTPPR
jgi:c-di-GMP-binding flagellar brake protein YcgR